MTREKKERRYRKIRVGLWTDSRYRSLPKTEPSARHLYWFLRTGPHTTMIPGVFQARAPGLADELGWETQEFKTCFEELIESQLAFADWDEGLVFLPDVIVDEQPRSVNQIEGWRIFWLEFPSCDLKKRIHRHFDEYFKKGPRSYLSIFLDIFGRIDNESKKKQERTQLCDDTSLERTTNFVQEETKKKSGLTVNSKQLTVNSEYSNEFIHTRNQKESITKQERTQLCSNTNEQVVRGRKLDPSALRKKKNEANKKKKGLNKKGKETIHLPDSDLFCLPEKEKQKILDLLESKNDEDEKKRRFYLDELQQLVLDAYSVAKKNHTGNGYHRLGKHGKEAARKIGIGCLAYNLTPKDLIVYWAKNHWTKMSFPTLLFVSSEKNIETAAAELSGSNRKKKGYVPVNERFEDDSVDDFEELQLLAEKRDREVREAKTERTENGAAGKIGDTKRITRGRRKNAGN